MPKERRTSRELVPVLGNLAEGRRPVRCVALGQQKVGPTLPRIDVFPGRHDPFRLRQVSKQRPLEAGLEGAKVHLL